jgi:hypothetical protein
MIVTSNFLPHMCFEETHNFHIVRCDPLGLYIVIGENVKARKASYHHPQTGVSGDYFPLGNVMSVKPSRGIHPWAKPRQLAYNVKGSTTCSMRCARIRTKTLKPGRRLTTSPKYRKICNPWVDLDELCTLGDLDDAMKFASFGFDQLRCLRLAMGQKLSFPTLHQCCL